MKAQELRVDNWVWLSSHKKHVGQVDLGFVQLNLDLFTPIELTEEWLLKFAFEKIDDYTYEHVDEDYWIWTLGHYSFNDSTYSIQIGKDLKYVHQLQNLYYALTGKELNIN